MKLSQLRAGWIIASFLLICALSRGDDPLARFADPIPAPPRVAFEGGKFTVRPGEVIVVTGPANAVFEQQQGSLETRIAVAAKAEKPIFRHMSWEGDTVYEQWRAMNFGGWREQFNAVNASTIITWFGQIEALDDTRTVEDFANAYGKLLDEFKAVTPRIVVISPPLFQKPPGKSMRDNTSRNDRVKAHSEITKKLAAERGFIFVQLDDAQALPTEDGLHFTSAGQSSVAKQIAAGLGVDSNWTPAHDAVREQIVAKNRLWFDCWRTMNWYFSYGDRTGTSFDKPAAGRPNLAEELAQYKPLVRAADARVHAAALGQPLPEQPAGTPEPAQQVESPEIEQKSLQLRDGFEVNLFASEADGLVKPIQIIWDERGRMWAACAPSYPQLVPGVKPSDYILICEDTNGDGRVDKSHRFAEGLTMPTGLCLGDGGLYVCENTQLVHLRDTNGDGKADERRVILSGFGTGDSHQMINSPCWGPDGRLWFTQGLHIFSTVETPYGLSRCTKTGIWRLNPRTRELHNFLGNASGSENAWGVGWNEQGQTFYTPGNEPGCYYLEPALIPLAVSQLGEGHYRPLGKLADTGPKGMRTEFLSSPHLPDDLQGIYVKSTYIAGFVELSRFTDDGSAYKSQLVGNLISSSQPAFRPLETRVGPDGAIYICDWCNPIIGHYQASYRDPRRDHVHGRVWRMTAKGRPLDKPPALATMSAAELLDQLASPQRWVREQAKRMLSDKPTSEVIPAADAWIVKQASLPPDALAKRLFEVIGVYAAHEEVRPELLERLLTSPEPWLRAFGTHMIGLWADRLPQSLELVERMAADPDQRVRMEAVVSASYLHDAKAIEAATIVLDQPCDRWITYSLTQTVKMLKPLWHPALQRGELRFAGQIDRLRFVLEADNTKDVAGFVKQLALQSASDPVVTARLLPLLVTVGTPEDLRYALDHANRNVGVLNELVVAAKVLKKQPSGDLIEPVKALLADSSDDLRTAGLRLAKVWKLEALAPEVQKELDRKDAPESLRIAAVESIGTLKPDSTQMCSFTQPIYPPRVRTAAVATLAQFDLPAATRRAWIVMRASELNEAEMTELIVPIVSRRGGSEELAKVMPSYKPSADSAKLALRVLSAGGHPSDALVDLLNKISGIQATSIEYSADKVTQIVSEMREHGNAARGGEVYRSKLANCIACHKLAGQGGDVGPDLSAVGRSMTPELLVEALLWPNRQVKEGYMAIRVLTADGQVFTGYKLKDTPAELQLRDVAANQVRRIAKSEIEEVANAGTVMPESITAAMTADEVRDLVRFLSEQGR